MIIITGLMIWVVPRFELVFQDLPGSGRLPGFTQAVLGICHGLTSHLGWVATGLAVLGLSLPAIGRTRRRRRWFDGFKLGLPGLGALSSKIAIARFARSLGTLLHSGVLILPALMTIRWTTRLPRSCRYSNPS